MRLAARSLVSVATVIGLSGFCLNAAARPGGGQSFSSPSRSSGSSSWGSSSRSSGGSSWGGSSSPSRSGGSSSWSWGSSPSRSSSDTPSYQPSYSSSRESRELDRSIRVTQCQQRCTSLAIDPDQTKYDKCRSDCEKASYEPEPTYDSSGGSPPRDRSMTQVLAAPAIALAALGAVAFVLAALRRRRDAEWASSGITDDDWVPPKEEERLAGEKYPTIQKAIAALQGKDAAFSWVLFEDFVYALYTEAHTARGNGQLSRLEPYLSPAAIDSLSQLSMQPVKAIIVGSLKVDEVRADATSRKIIVGVSFESNYTEGERSYYVRERWVLSRSADTPSRPMDRARTVDCPNCGAPLDKTIAGKCGYCNTVSGDGNLDWRVDRIETIEREVRGPLLIGTTEEVGTDLPTVVAPDVKQRWTDLAAKDSAVTWTALVSRIEATFAAFHTSWSAQDLAGVRPFLSDNLFETQKYWVNAYKSEGLRNVTEGAKIATLHLSRVESDALFDLVTVRVYASCRDYTTNKTGHVVGGSKTDERQYSEYWTFIRGAGVRGAPRVDPVCPSCGAPSDQIDMAGTCQHCHAKITNGAFDWVLSRIEQDEVYDIA